MVQSPATPANYDMVQQIVAADGDSLQLGHRIDRVLLHGAGQPHRLYRQRRPIQPLAAQGYPRIRFPHRFHPYHRLCLQERNTHGQPPHWFLLSGVGCLFYLQKIGFGITFRGIIALFASMYDSCEGL